MKNTGLVDSSQSGLIPLDFFVILLYIKSMNKTITLSDQQHSLLLDLFSSIADLDLQEHCDDSSEFDALWDAVIDAKEYNFNNEEVK